MDGDGILDGGEIVNVGDSGEIIDSDGDGIPNFADLDSDNDGIPDSTEGFIDSDGDGLGNAFDLDSDNDGITDVIEAGGVDADNDGQADDVGSSLVPIDSDGDGVTDELDLDSDNDGLPDLVEAGGTDTNGDGRIDDFTDEDFDGLSDSLGGAGLADIDTDGDSQPNRIDLDSDNDGISDLVESGGVDTDNDQMVDDFTDANGDGFDDALDGIVVEFPDTDGDGVSDVLDSDVVLDDEGVVVTPTAGDEALFITGVEGGFGCSVAPGGIRSGIQSGKSRFDPSMPLLLLLSLCGLFYSRKANGLSMVRSGRQKK